MPETPELLQPHFDPDFAQDTGRSLANALAGQLGLKLQPAKGMADVLVVDRIERPTPN